MTEKSNNDIHDLTIAFIGSGTMAEAMIKGILAQELTPAGNIIASGPRPERGQTLIERYSVRATTDNREAASQADVVVLSVKPQVMPRVMAELSSTIPSGTLILSIAAGVPTHVIAKGLGVDEVVRAMPNTPAQVGMGMTVWTSTPGVTDRQRGAAQTILSALGEEIHSEDEGDLDRATALSGTGPAYVFLIMEALTDAGVHLGFSRRVAEELVLQTLRGSVEYAIQSKRHLAALRNQVTSPGGTSAAALYQLEKGMLRTVLSRAIWAAYQRCIDLGEGEETNNK